MMAASMVYYLYDSSHEIKFQKCSLINVDNRYAIVDANHEEICIFGHLCLSATHGFCHVLYSATQELKHARCHLAQELVMRSSVQGHLAYGNEESF